MGFRVRHIVVLIYVKGIRCLLRDSFGNFHVTVRMMVVQFCGCDNDFCAIGLEHVDLFLTHFVRYRNNAAIAFRGGRHRKT